MSSHPCCALHEEVAEARVASNDPGLAKPLRPRRGLVGMVFPSVLLALLPKCPVCIAAYVAMATGIGLSVAAATYLQIGIASICVLILVCLAARYVRLLIPRVIAMVAASLR